VAVDFSFNNIIGIVSDAFFSGNTTIAGLIIMLVITFIMMAILANIKAPVQYSLAPMIILSVVFAAMGIMDTTVSFLIVILCAVLIAAAARRVSGS